MRSVLEQLVRRQPVAGSPLVIAHRGASAAAPENTLVALRLAVEQGADLVEIDVQRTRDGALVVMHDATLARTTNVRQVYPDRAPWRVGDLTLDEVQRLDAGSWKAPDYAGEPVPTLSAALELLASTRVGLQLELKAPTLYPGIVSDLAEALAEVPTAQIVVQSFDFASMKELTVRTPGLRVGLLGAPAATHLPVLGTWADQVNPPHRVADRRYVEAIHAQDMHCCVWTVDAASSMRRAARHHVDGVITNKPDLLRRVVSAEPSTIGAGTQRWGRDGDPS